MFSITFTKAQAEQFIHGIFQKNFRDNPEFIVRISDEESNLKINDRFSDKPVEFTVDSSVVNPWLTPDENGWFTHDPKWKLKEAPKHVDSTKQILAIFRDGDVSHSAAATWDYDWKQQGKPWDVAKWKYAE